MSEYHVVGFMVMSITIFLLVDVKLAMDKKPGNTYSEIIRNTGNRHPWFRALVFVMSGFVLGHWFW